MKIWIDILTPKQLLFSEPIVEQLGEKHKILCTSRKYGEVLRLAEIRNFNLISFGKHGGIRDDAKLQSSIERMGKLFRKIKDFKPDLTISFCSPEAARIAFGLKIKHIAFCDSPHAEAVMRLTLPLIQKLFIPRYIPKKDFAKFGIDTRNIIPYNAIDASVTIKRKINENADLPFEKNGRKNILIRIEEYEASYVSKSKIVIPIIEQLVHDYSDENVVILGRYTKQIRELKKIVNRKAKVVKMTYDGKHLLNNSDIFVGSGGTMTAESALMGIPTISYSAIPNIIESYLIKKNMIKKETNPKKISNHVKKMIKLNKIENKEKAERVVDKMEDPIQVLIKNIRK